MTQLSELTHWMAGGVMVPHAEMESTGEEADLRKGRRDDEFCLGQVGLKNLESLQGRCLGGNCFYRL